MQDEAKDVLQNMEATFHRVTLLAHEEPELYNLIVLRKYSRKASEKPPLARLSERASEGGHERRG